jgi:hypothetical protein
VYWLSKARALVNALPKCSFERSVAVSMVGFVIVYLLSGMSLELRYFGFFNGLFWIAGATIERTAIIAQENQSHPASQPTKA